MPPNSSNDPALVVAAQAGDQRALDDLIAAYLPFVYTIVRRAMIDPPECDDVVQDSMVRALRELRELRTPESFRAWLGAITVRQISTHLHRRSVNARRTAPLDDLAGMPDADASFEGLTMLRLDLADQRHQAVRAARWLDGDDRTLLSLWWLEVAGKLSRTELATATGVSVAHAGVRVQRMRQQFDQCRALVAAVSAQPRCTDLDGVLKGWDGTPSTAWRKRITRHVGSCGTCTPTVDRLVSADRLLVGAALLPVPAALAAALIGKGALAGAASSAALTAGAKAGLLGNLTKAVASHSVVTVLVAGTLAAGTTAAVLNWPASPPALPAVAAPLPPADTPALPSPSAAQPSPSAAQASRRSSPSPSRSAAGPLTAGPASLESAAQPGHYATIQNGVGVLAALSATSAATARQQATFDVVAGLADAGCFSFRAADGRYLRHQNWRTKSNYNDGTELFRSDATFCVRPGSTSSSLVFESQYAGWFLHRRGGELWVDYTDGSAAFLADSSFRIRPPLADR